MSINGAASESEDYNDNDDSKNRTPEVGHRYTCAECMRIRMTPASISQGWYFFQVAIYHVGFGKVQMPSGTSVCSVAKQKFKL